VEQMMGRHLARQRLFPQKTILTAAEEEVAAMPVEQRAPPAAADPPQQPNITFVGDFSAHENSIMQIIQGGVEINGDPCCSSDSPYPQCQIQMQHRGGMRYMDIKNQRTRFDDEVSGEMIADDFTSHMSMLLNKTDGVDTCQEYCPLDPQDTLTPIDPFDPFDKTVDKGATTIDGKAVEHYFWADKILKIITMSKTDFYADIKDPKNAIPVFLSQHLTPLGQDLGRTNQTWSNLKAGTPSADHFKIAGMKTCPKSSKCQSSNMLMHHVQTRNYHTLASLLEHMPQHATMSTK